MKLKNFIEGVWHEGTADPLRSTASGRGHLIAEGLAAGTEQAQAAVSAAAEAFNGWRTTTYDERLAIVTRFAAIAKDRKDEMAALIAEETGKALWDAATEAGAIAGKAGLAAASYEERTPTVSKQKGGTTLRLTHKPHGVMVVVGPFNFPGHLPNGQITPSLLAGNCVVFKPSEQTPAVGQKMVAWWQEAGLPDGVLNLVHGGREVGEALIGHKHTAGVLFTGGIEAGRAIHRTLAGRPDVLLALELGGNNPLIGWDIANVEDAAQIVIRSAYITSGQRCTCARRLIIDDGPAGEDLIKAVMALIPRLRVDHPDAQPAPFMGPLISDQSADQALNAQARLIAEGALPLLPMERLNLGNAFLTPGLLDVTTMTEDPDEEVFAPLLKVIRVKNFDEALDRANDTRFGLAAALLSDSADRWEAFSKTIRAGIVNWNRQTTGASGSMPFGGPGLSGNHRPAGSYAADFCAWPMASMLAEGPLTDDQGVPGMKE